MDWLQPTWLWTLTAALPVLGLFLWAARRRRAAIRRFGNERLVARLAPGMNPRRRRWKAAAVLGGLILLCIALAGPRFGTQLREVERKGVDLIIALDVSASMHAEDVAPNRLDRARNEIKKLLEMLRGDRVGLVVFAGDAFLQCPLTTDYSALRLFLDIAGPEMVPTPGTDFGAAMRMAIRALDVRDEPPDEERGRALLIVSDGENHVAEIDDLVAEARQAGVTVFAAGVGEIEGGPIPIRQRGTRVGFRTTLEGDLVHTRLEEAGLQQLAAEGAYFRIARTSSSLSKITDELDRLEKGVFAQEEFEEYEERYQWPLALGLLLLFAERLVADRRRKRVENPFGS